jgi:hypothetical protein
LCPIHFCFLEVFVFSAPTPSKATPSTTILNRCKSSRGGTTKQSYDTGTILLSIIPFLQQIASAEFSCAFESACFPPRNDLLTLVLLARTSSKATPPTTILNRCKSLRGGTTKQSYDASTILLSIIPFFQQIASATPICTFESAFFPLRKGLHTLKHSARTTSKATSAMPPSPPQKKGPAVIQPVLLNSYSAYIMPAI